MLRDFHILKVRAAVRVGSSKNLSGTTSVLLRYSSGTTPALLRYHSGTTPIVLRYYIQVLFPVQFSGTTPVGLPIRHYSDSTPVLLRNYSGNIP